MKSFRRELKLAMRAGDYRPELLRDWRRLYAHSKLPLDYLHTVSFQRALGIPPSSRQQQQLAKLRQLPFLYRTCIGLHRYQVRQIDNLLQHRQSHTEPAVEPQYRNQIRQWRSYQADWFQTLTEQIQRAQRIAVVGNSPELKQSNLGAEIDTADLVIRFNHFASEHTRSEDIGHKTNVWVVAPGYDGPFPEQFDSILLSGPDMLWWQQNWAHLGHLLLDESNRHIEPEQQTPVISIPLQFWQPLVKNLSAPPSAGLLVLELIRQLLSQDDNANKLKKLKIYGFNFASQHGSQYHHANPQHRAVSRHNWAAESQYLRTHFSSYA